jgi:hypothetical protein
MRHHCSGANSVDEWTTAFEVVAVRVEDERGG